MSKWIYCTDRMPEIEERVLALRLKKHFGTEIVLATWTGEKWVTRGAMPNERVLAWAKIPELPDESEMFRTITEYIPDNDGDDIPGFLRTCAGTDNEVKDVVLSRNLLIDLANWIELRQIESEKVKTENEE